MMSFLSSIIFSVISQVESVTSSVKAFGKALSPGSLVKLSQEDHEDKENVLFCTYSSTSL